MNPARIISSFTTRLAVARRLLVVAALILAVVTAWTAPYYEGRIRLTVRDSVRAKDIPVTITYSCDSSSGDNRPLVGTGVGAIPTFGVVVVGHGFQMPVTAYKTLATTICQNAANYIVVLPESGSGLFPNHADFAQDMAAVAAYMQREGKRKASVWEGHIRDETHLAGHSMGGGATFLAAKVLLQAGTPRLSGVIAFAPAETNPSSSDAAASVTCPTLILAGGADCVTPLASTVQPIYDKLAAKCKVLAVIPGASHCQFADANSTCNLGELNCKATITRDVQFARCWQYLNRFLAQSDDVARVIDNTQIQTTMVFPSAADVALSKSEVCVGDSVSVRYTGAARGVLWLPDSVRTATLTTRVQPGGSPLSLIVTTCFGTTRIDTAVHTIPVPTVQIVGDSLMCPGDSVQLFARTNSSSANPVSVRWSTGETSENIVVRQPGTISVTAMSGRGCGSAICTTSVATVDVPRITLRFLGDTILCYGKGAAQVSLQGETDRIESVRWSTGEISRSISLHEPGRYSLSAALVVRGERMCTSATDTIAVNLRSVAPTVPVVRYERDTLWSTPADAYQWSHEGVVISGARKQEYVPTRNGAYTVTTSRRDEGMCEATSQPFKVVLSSVDDDSTVPSLILSGKILRVRINSDVAAIVVRTVRGETVISASASDGSSGWLSIDLGDLPVGVYSISCGGQAVGTVLYSGTTSSH